MQDAISAHWANPSGTAPWRRYALFGALVVIYFFAGKLGLHFAFVHASASAVWPPTGIALAVLLLFGRRVWPAILVGAFLVNLSTTGTLASSLGIAIGNTLEAVVGTLLVERYADGKRTFEQARNCMLFALFAGLLSTAVSATIGAISLVLAGDAPWSALSPIWLTWWLGDAAGALVITPLLVLWGNAPRAGILRDRPFEAVALLLVTAVTAALVLAHPALSRYPLPFMCIPPLIWAAFRFGQREVATLVALIALIATWSTVHGVGPFVMPSDNESLLLLQAFMATMASLTMPVAALVWERKTVEAERTRLLERERAARAEAEDANRAKDEFLAMLSHELRNPLAALANAGQVLHTAPNSAFSGRAIEIINRQTRHLARLIDDLLDVARVSSGKILLSRERTNLADVAQGCLTLLRSSGRLEEHKVSVELQPVWVNADPARMMQIIDNLLLNALRYTPKGGRIEVQTSREHDEAVLRVQDDGVGIAAELLPRIFDLFMQGPRTLDRAQGGLGIGLTLAHRLTLAHGGRIAASSSGAGCGSVFTVRLPIAEPFATNVAGPGIPAMEKSSPRRILIIEDDADGREALRLQLMQAGHDVYEAASGIDGLEAAVRVKPEVVLLDIGLPGLDGYQVAQRLRAKDNSPRLIAITGYGQPEDRRRALDAGIEQHLVKPVDAAQLMRLLG